VEGKLEQLFKTLLYEKESITPGEAIRIVRKARGLQQKYLSELVGISNSYLCDIEKERVIPSIKTMEKIGSKLVEDVGDYNWQFFLLFNYDKNVKKDK